MNTSTYSYHAISLKEYRFISIGKKQIVKLVQFKATTYKNVVNLGFGDQLPDGRIDDGKISNNGDMAKVIATVIRIAYDFTIQFPHLKIAFTGSTPERTRLYNRILKKNYKDFISEFGITAFVEKAETVFEVDFDPDFSGTYLVYFIKRKM